MIRYDACSAFPKPRALCLASSALSLALSGALERRAEASHAYAGSPAPTAAIKPDGEPSVAVLELAEYGRVAAVEVMRTPGVWEGRILGDTFGGGVVMRVQTTVGEVVYVQGSDGSVLQSLPAGDGSRRVHLRSKLPGCGGAIAPDKADWGEGGAEGSIASNCDDGSVLDVLVRWTPTAEAEAGGPTAIRAVAEAAVAMSNHVYLASGVPVYMRAVGYGVTEPFTNDAASSVLGQLANPSDGVLDGVHAERDTAGADLVALLTGQNPEYCGRAYLSGTNRPDLGFSVTVWSCVSGLTFTHEIGHNQGCCHAPDDGGGCVLGGIYTYSFGHRFTATDGIEYRTVLAYSPGIRIPRLSSPTVQYVGTPTGLDVADNARKVRETAAIMASYRCTAPCSTLPLRVRSPMLSGPVAGEVATFTAANVPKAFAGTVVEISVSALGDLDAADETLSMRIGSTELGVVVGGAAQECRIQSRTTSVPASLFNAAIGSGSEVVFALHASAAVSTCPASEVSVELRYLGSSLPCSGDLNDDGSVNGSDLSVVLSAWGPCCNCTADANRDGVVNGSDLTPVLSGWGACPVVPPTLTSVTPALGAVSGGALITLTGSRLLGATSVTVGGVPATSVQVLNSSTVTAVAPAGSVGARDVTVTTPGGAATRTGGFTYVAASVPAWATLVEPLPDPAVVTDPAMQWALAATGYAWRVRDTATQIEMVLIPPGTFQMGCSPSNQSGCLSNESPVHSVTLTQPFYMGRFEVTQAQWTARMGSNPSGFQSSTAEVPASQVPNRPVERVSWTTIQGFLSATGMRLPTEAEWEYAYRAGTATAFHSMAGQPNGTNVDSLLGTIAWIQSNSVSQTRPVGLKVGNGFGLHDMSGNVWEWVNDWYGQGYYSASPPADPPGPATGDFRVLRGGSVSNLSNPCRSSYRHSLSPFFINGECGFRVARNP